MAGSLIPTRTPKTGWLRKWILLPDRKKALVLLLAVHGTLGAQLAAEFGVHIAAGQLLQAGADLTTALP